MTAEKSLALSAPTAVMVEDGTEILVMQAEAPPKSYRLTTAMLDETIARYGSVRAGMMPAVAADFEGGQLVEARIHPSWVLGCDTLAGDPLLHIRHDGFGWLHFSIGRDDARCLAEALIKIANEPPPAAAGQA